MAGFVLLRLRAHRWLFAAGLLTVLLTTCVMATLTAQSTVTVPESGVVPSLKLELKKKPEAQPKQIKVNINKSLAA